MPEQQLASRRRRSLQTPWMGFAEEAQSRIDQDLLMLESGIRTKALLRRLAAYKELVASPSAQHEEFAQRYAERVRQASAAPAGKSRHVPGNEVWPFIAASRFSGFIATYRFSGLIATSRFRPFIAASRLYRDS